MALALAVCPGCSGDAKTAAPAEDALGTAEEIATLKGSSHGMGDFRKKLREKARVSQGDFVIKTAPEKANKKKPR
jgi:hypothetical protein